MSGSLLVNAIAREHGRSVGKADLKRLEKRQAEKFRELSQKNTALPGAVKLLDYLTKADIHMGLRLRESAAILNHR